MSQTKLIVVIVFVFLLVSFTIMNQAPVAIQFFGLKSAPISLSFIIFGAILFGAFFSAILGWLDQRKIKQLLKEKEKQIKMKDEKINQLQQTFSSQPSEKPSDEQTE